MKWIIIPLILFSNVKCSFDYEKQVITGAERTEVYLDLLHGKRIAIMANQTSLIGTAHTVDSLLSLGIDIRKIFSMEHGFRGTEDRGVAIGSDVDPDSGLPVISLYGGRTKPSAEDLEDIDLVIWDIQDMGVRFFTTNSSLQRLMEGCAENNVPLLLFDRPDPHGHYIDGPLLDTAFRSFVGMQPVPVIYGMTAGEYAGMLNGEGLLSRQLKCNLTVIKCSNYSHESNYVLPVKPSPNLPNQKAVLLYPSLCFFEGTTVSVGRGTRFPFQVFGHPSFPNMGFSFKPLPVEGASDPILSGQECFGHDLRLLSNDSIRDMRRINLQWLIDSYNEYPDESNFFTGYFNTLAGNNILQEQIKQGLTEDEIRSSWQTDLGKFEKIRKKYLLYQ